MLNYLRRFLLPGYLTVCFNLIRIQLTWMLMPSLYQHQMTMSIVDIAFGFGGYFLFVYLLNLDALKLREME